jgi:hypothetical protein
LLQLMLLLLSVTQLPVSCLPLLQILLPVVLLPVVLRPVVLRPGPGLLLPVSILLLLRKVGWPSVLLLLLLLPIPRDGSINLRLVNPMNWRTSDSRLVRELPLRRWLLYSRGRLIRRHRRSDEALRLFGRRRRRRRRWIARRRAGRRRRNP